MLLITDFHCEKIYDEYILINVNTKRIQVSVDF